MAQPFLSDNPNNNDLKLIFLTKFMMLVGTHGWYNASLVEAAYQAGLSLEQATLIAPGKISFISILNQHIDSTSLTDISLGENLRENIFDCFMQRFDIMQNFRMGIISILNTLPFDPALAAYSATISHNSFQWMSDILNLDHHGIKGFIRMNAFIGLWGYAVHLWKHDKSLDMTATMNGLADALKHLEKIGMLKKKESFFSSSETVNLNNDDLPDL